MASRRERERRRRAETSRCGVTNLVVAGGVDQAAEAIRDARDKLLEGSPGVRTGTVSAVLRRLSEVLGEEFDPSSWTVGPVKFHRRGLYWTQQGGPFWKDYGLVTLGDVPVDHLPQVASWLRRDEADRGKSIQVGWSVYVMA